jgi:hypothetical protein
MMIWQIEILISYTKRYKQQKTRLQTGFNYLIYLLFKYQFFLHTLRSSQ